MLSRSVRAVQAHRLYLRQREADKGLEWQPPE